MQLPAGNIYSGSRMLAVLTAPTELARRKGNLRNSYPVMLDWVEYPDVETAYQRNKPEKMSDREALMIRLLLIRFDLYPAIGEAVKDSGGVEWLEQCEHVVTGNVRWEGKGRESRFIRCLIAAYELWLKDINL